MDESEVSWIARERVGPGPPSNQWVTAAIVLAGAVFLVLAVMGLSPVERTEAEEAYRAGDGPVQALDASLSPSMGRILRSASAATAVLATCFAARRLLHHEPASILAGGLVMLDTGFLVHGRLATPVAPATAAAMLALALFLSTRKHSGWAGAVSLAIACFLDPVHLAWTVPLAVLALLRGHIYAAPQHAYTAGLQAFVIPGIGALFGIIAGASLGSGCFVPDRAPALLLLQTVDLGSNIHWHPNPVLWFGGLGAILWLGITAGVTVLRDFRLQRLPGRIQVRLTDRLRRSQGRALWLLAFAALAPTAALWAPLFAIGIAAAVLELGRDNRRFGWAIAIGLVLLVLAYTIRLWPLLVGGDPGQAEALARTIPWSTSTSC